MKKIAVIAVIIIGLIVIIYSLNVWMKLGEQGIQEDRKAIEETGKIKEQTEKLQKENNKLIQEINGVSR